MVQYRRYQPTFKSSWIFRSLTSLISVLEERGEYILLRNGCFCSYISTTSYRKKKSWWGYIKFQHGRAPLTDRLLLPHNSTFLITWPRRSLERPFTPSLCNGNDISVAPGDKLLTNHHCCSYYEFVSYEIFIPFCGVRSGMIADLAGTCPRYYPRHSTLDDSRMPSELIID